MPTKKEIEDKDGNKHVVYDAAEVEKTIKDKEDGFATEKQTLEKTAKEAKEAFDKVDKTNKDFDTLRTAKEAAEKLLKEKTEAHEKEVGELKGKPLVDHKESLTKIFAGEDKDMKAKIEHHMEKSLASMPETTKEEIDAKIKSAYQLAAGVNYDETTASRVISSAGAGHRSSGGKVNEDLKSIGKNFGLSDKDFEAADKEGLL